MRALPLLVISLLGAGSGLCQKYSIAPVPPDPLELVTGPTQVPATPEQRGALVALLNRAIEHYSLHARGTPAHVLQISFAASASTLNPGGSGQLRETWLSGENWRWDGTLGGYTLLRISSNAAVYDQNPNSMIPLRLKMLANAVFAPIQGAPRRETLRTASVQWKGSPITCILMSPAGNPETAQNGRQWYETEYCIDPATGLLDIYSIAPGIYTVYDYTNALKFHDRMLPGKITITENAATVVEAQLTNLADTDSATSGSLLTPTAQMVSQGAATALALPGRFPIRAPRAGSGTVIEPVIVHAVIESDGKVLESEALQTSSVSTTALNLVNGMKFPAPKPASGAPAMEREAFINVQFQPLP
jgi:hypothetical protein